MDEKEQNGTIELADDLANTLGKQFAELAYVMRVMAVSIARMPGAEPKRLAKRFSLAAKRTPVGYDLAQAVLLRIADDARRVKTRRWK